MKRFTNIFVIAAVLIGFTSVSAYAAAPDGDGPWADSVVEANQGFLKSGNPVRDARSNPEAALGVAEMDGSDETTFYSLGFGGDITLGFDQRVCNLDGDDLEIWETTNGTYPDEVVMLEASMDGVDWVNLGYVTTDGSVDLGTLEWAMYVRVVDMTDADIHNNSADAYDLDGVMSLHDPADCADPEEPEMLPWLGDTRTQGYWKNHDSYDDYETDDRVRGFTFTKKVKGDKCLIYGNQFVAFINNWRNNVSYEGVKLQTDTIRQHG